MEVKKKANAKINLTLDLIGILPNGYHSIFTCMQSIDMHDVVRINKTPTGITLNCSENYIPLTEKNTAFAAAKYFLDAAGISSGCDIYIKKVIPSSAGLGGGSADAAAVIEALSEIYPGRLSKPQLHQIALKVGTDVPFCLYGGTKLCQNTGDIISPLPNFDSYVLIAKPVERVSAKDAYKRFDSAVNIRRPDNQSFLFYAASGNYKKALEYAANVFEVLSDVDSGEEIKNIMRRGGAYFSAMSGSGTAYFGLFDDIEKAEVCADKLRQTADTVFVCKTKIKGIE